MKRNIALSIISALLVTASFSPYGTGLLALVGIIPFLFALESASVIETAGRAKKTLFLGFIWGLVFSIGTIYWVVNSMYYYGGIGIVPGFLIMLVLAAYLAIFPAFFALCFYLTHDWRPLLRLFIIPALWVGTEFLRGAFSMGLPWTLLGYSQVGIITFIQVSDIFGVWGVSYWVMLLNVGIFLFILNIALGSGRRGLRIEPSLIFAATFAVVVFVIVYGAVQVRSVEKDAASWPVVKVGVAQGNIEQAVKWKLTEQKKTVEVYRELTQEIAVAFEKIGNEGPGLIVLPETSMPFFLARDKDMLPIVQEMAKDGGSYMLIGSPDYVSGAEGEYSILNTAFMLSPDGAMSGRYDKMHLVPFGEYVPLKRIFFFIKKLTAGAGEFIEGRGLYPINIDIGGEGLGVGVFICFEAIFPSLVAELSRGGAGLLVNITNDAWFGRTSAPYHHQNMTIMRAVENRSFLVRSANTGISVIVSPAGRVIERAGLFETAAITALVGMKKGKPTFFTRHPNLFPCASLIFSAIMVLLSLRSWRRH